MALCWLQLTGYTAERWVLQILWATRCKHHASMQSRLAAVGQSQLSMYCAVNGISAWRLQVNSNPNPRLLCVFLIQYCKVIKEWENDIILSTIRVESSWIVGTAPWQMTNLTTDETFRKWKLSFNAHDTYFAQTLNIIKTISDGMLKSKKFIRRN